MTESAPDVASLLFRAIQRYRAGITSLPRFVLELEVGVDGAELSRCKGANELRRIWGDLEIVNALSGDDAVSDPATDDVREIIDEMSDALNR